MKKEDIKPHGGPGRIPASLHSGEVAQEWSKDGQEAPVVLPDSRLHREGDSFVHKGGQWVKESRF